MSEAEYVRLESRGRRTGEPHGVLLRFITFKNSVVVFPQNDSNQDWVRNILADPQVTLHSRDRVMNGRASLRHVGGLDDPVLSVFQRKYGEAVVRARYWGQKDYFEISLTDGSSADGYDELVYADLEAAFDSVAGSYDHHILDNPVNLWLRNRSVDLMLKTFSPGQTVLEIGCGTGTETISLAKHGIRVVAADISSKMLAILEKKAENAGVADLIVPVHARPYMLKDRLKGLGLDSVDGAYSTYGAVNTDPRLDEMFFGLHTLVRPRGKLILGVWNRFCMYEILGYSIKLRPSMASARFRNPVPVGKSRFCVASNAYTVSDLSKHLVGLFTAEEVHGVGIFLPPSNLTKYLPHGRTLDIVKRSDVALETHFPWNRLGDHFLVVYSRAS